MKIEVKNKFFFGLWLLAALSILVLFIAASHKRKNALCSGIKIKIESDNQGAFVTEMEIAELINKDGTITERKIAAINVANLETALRANDWVKDAELYFDNNDLLHIVIKQRQPIARLFNVDGTSHYLDADALRLPVKNTATARVLAVTGFPSNNEVLAHADSLVLNDVKAISNFIYADSFWNAQIAQVNITNTGKFEMVPAIGNHIILFGSIDNLVDKFERLYTFYAKAWLQNGIDTYETIDLRFDKQVVAAIRGSSRVLAERKADSLGVAIPDSVSLLFQDSVSHERIF